MTQEQRSTRDRLLIAAREEFAANGIAGARVDRIAKLANVNKERIYGYFGSKQQLFDIVVARALDELAEAVPFAECDDAAEYAGRVYDLHLANPALLRLLLWEGLHYRYESLPNEAERAARYQQKVDALAKSFGAAVSSEVAATLLTLIGLAGWPNAVPQLARLIVGAAGGNSESKDDMRRHIVEFARRALTHADSPVGENATRTGLQGGTLWVPSRARRSSTSTRR